MKKLIVVFVLIWFVGNSLKAQDNGGYVLFPGPAKTLAPGQKLTLYLERVNTDGSFAGAPGIEVIKWTINGHAKQIAKTPAEGDLSIDLTLSKATYTAPAAAPDKNPVAIAVTARAPGESKATMILICNVTILNADYKVTAEFEATGPQGIHYKYKGESYTDLKGLADGTYMLAPVDKTQQMDLTIEDAAMTSHSTFVGPKEYKIPFLFTIDKMNPKQLAPTHATILFNTICPQKGKVEWIFHGDADVRYTCDIDNGSITYSPGTTQVIPSLAGNPFAMNGATNLDIFQYFGPTQVIQNASTNIANSSDLIEFSKRMMAHQNDPAYFKTAQGKADLQRMQAMQKQLGNNSGPKNFGEASLLKQAKADAPSNSDNSSKARILPGIARARVEDTFDPKSSNAFTGTLEGGIGPVQASIKVTVEKLR